MKRFVGVITVWAMGLASVLASVVLPAGLAAAATPELVTSIATAGVSGPGPVTHVRATPASTSIALSWAQGTDRSLTGVMIRRALGATPPAKTTDGTLVTHVAKPVTSFKDSGLRPGTKYSYALFAHDATPIFATGATITSATTAFPAATGRLAAALGVLPRTAGALAALIPGEISISGTVTEAGGDHQGLVNVDVTAFSETAGEMGYARTAADGTYTMTGLTAGSDYVVCFYAFDAAGGALDVVGYADQCFDNQPTTGTPTPVIVTTDGTASGIDAGLEGLAALSGTVTDAAGTLDALELVGVSVYSPTTGSSGSAETAADGSYTVSKLAAGTDYKVCFQGYRATGGSSDLLGYADECYDNQPTRRMATPVILNASETTRGIDASMGAAGGISGKVTEAGGSQGLGNAWVTVESPTRKSSGFVETAADGTYTVYGLTPSADYEVCFEADHATGGPSAEIGYADQCFDKLATSEAPTPVVVTTGLITPDINAALRVGASISGKVTEAGTTHGVMNIDVEVYSPTSGSWIVKTAVNGTYSVPGLPAGDDYEVCFLTSDAIGQASDGRALGYVDECFDNKGASEALTQVAVTAGESVTGIDAALALATSSPGSPTDASAAAGDGQARVYWTAPVSDGGEPITWYTIAAYPGGETTTATGATTDTVIVNGLTNGTAYTFTVTARNMKGTSLPSPATSAVTPGTIPGAPVDPKATAGNAQAVVSWTAPVSNGGGSPITRYTVTASPGGRTATTTGATIVPVTGLTNGIAYTFTVTATNDVGTSPASAKTPTVTPTSPTPGAPTAVSATAGNAQAVVSWTAPASNGGSPVTSYTVTRHPGGQTVTTQGAITATVTGLANGSPYTFTVTATSSGGTSGASAPSVAVTPAAPVIPLGKVQRYINKVYFDLFDRTPDSEGLATWTSWLGSGTPRVEVANGITYSDEYRSKLITGSYERFLTRVPDQGGLTNWLAAMGGGLTISQMESGFIASDEYWNKADATPQGWVNKLYADVLGRPASSSEVAGWTTNLANGMRRDQVAMGFLLSSERLTTVVNGHYQALLGRDIDPSGQATWVGILQRGGRDEAIIGGIIASDEYYGKV